MPLSVGLAVLPEYESLAYDERKGTFVVALRPPPAPQKRPPLRLVLALDISGSMGGDKLTTALASAQAVVGALTSDDTFACVTFNERAQVVLPPTPMNAPGKSLASQRLAAVQARGNTNLGDAILSSLELVRATAGRVLLLTDGCPTEGVTSPDQLLQLTRGASGGATLSAFGFGRDVNPLLLSSLSDAGRGNYTFIEAGEPPVQAIAAEVGGLLMTVAANAVLRVTPAADVTLDKVLRASDVAAVDGAVELSLPALIAEEEVCLPISLRWAEAALGREVARVELRAYDVTSGQPIEQRAAIQPRFAPQRGPLQRPAAREILLGRAAMALRYASQATSRSGRELAIELAQLRGELTGYGAAAGLDDDQQVAAALQMLLDAQHGLEADRRREASTRQDMVATSAALSKKRSTLMGLKQPSQQASQAAFVSRSQLVGIDFVTKSMLDNDPSKKKPGE